MIKILGLIPARSSSQGVPGKNLRLVGGKPLIWWTCKTAQQAPSISRIICSTNSEEIAHIAKDAGVEVPFLRPHKFATDDAIAIDVIQHCLDWLHLNQEWYPDLILWLQPTSPLRTSGDIEAAIKLLHNKQADSVVSVCSTNHPTDWIVNIDAEEGGGGEDSSVAKQPSSAQKTRRETFF